MFDRIRNVVCVWRPRCLRCFNRRPEFLEGMCFECHVDLIEQRIWDSFKRWLEDRINAR